MERSAVVSRPLVATILARLRQIALIAQARGTGDLAEHVAVVRVLDLDQLFHQIGPSDQVAEPDTRQAVTFAERAGDDYVRMILEQRQGVVARIGKIGIRFVDDQRAIERIGQVGDLIALECRPRWTIGIGQKE